VKSFLIFLTLVSAIAVAAPAKKPASKTKKMDFDKQLVEGEVYRPDYSVVTGEAPGEGWGVLRLRRSFQDHAKTDAKESGR
jgi:hypothetical protein